MDQPSFDVYQNCKSGEFVISRNFKDEHGLHCDTGPFLKFTQEQMKSDGLRFAEEHFTLFATRKVGEPSQFRKMPPIEQKRFRRDHIHVFVYRHKPNEIRFSPTHLVMRKGHVIPIARDPEYRVHLPWPTTAERFYEALLAALENAC